MPEAGTKKRNFFICFVKTRKKLDKYFKNNRIKNKQIIDIKKILEEEKIILENVEAVNFFKVLVWSKIKMAREKGKDIYYIPNFFGADMDAKKLLKLKNSLLEKNECFNLLCFYDEFVGTVWLNDILDNIEHFDATQILKDY